MSDPQSTLKQLEKETWTALCKSGSDLLPYLAPGCKMLFPDGMMLSSTTSPSLESVMTDASFVPWNGYSLKDMKVTMLGDRQDTGEVTYRANADRNEKEYDALVSSIWAKQSDGSWKMQTHQQTPC